MPNVVYVTMEWEVPVPDELEEDEEILNFLQEKFDDGSMLDEAEIVGWAWDEDAVLMEE